ncbi:hypothetical protein NFX46_23200 [Streptomyces phaeoluteigriseus]|uniref:Integrase n=1 Tax=Streptomyces phaeoluteigriseus TaxID=114686 RepID=A0ABY4ZLG2_9ACTN|nr:hypothetical protein [Streptomyces phaeoluteigriseus]USQ89859.1 hypothetical protein NFX46_23200 [Streptomyces phaeoluteigriseus]
MSRGPGPPRRADEQRVDAMLPEGLRQCRYALDGARRFGGHAGPERVLRADRTAAPVRQFIVERRRRIHRHREGGHSPLSPGAADAWAKDSAGMPRWTTAEVVPHQGLLFTAVIRASSAAARL